MPEPDELTQQEILVQKTEVDRASALLIVRLVKEFRIRTNNEKSSGLRSCLMLGKVCHDHEIVASPGNADFRDLCFDVLLSRSSLPLAETTKLLWNLLNESIGIGLVEAEPNEPELNHSLYDVAIAQTEAVTAQTDAITEALAALALEAVMTEPDPDPIAQEASALETEAPELANFFAPSEAVDMSGSVEPPEAAESVEATDTTALVDTTEAEIPYEQEIIAYLKQVNGARLSQIERALELDRFRTVDVLRLLAEKGSVMLRDRLYLSTEG